jgi:hypothetical protein
MLGSFLKSIVNKFFGKYIEVAKEELVEIDKWNGIIIKHNVKIREGVLKLISKSIGIPLLLTYGHIGKIKINIPWQKLFTQPCVISLHEVHILASIDNNYDPKLAEKIRCSFKLANVNSILQKILSKEESDAFSFGKRGAESYKTQILRTIVENLEFSLEGLHFRIEDHNNIRKEAHFQFGVILKHLKFGATNKNYEHVLINLKKKKLEQKSYSKLSCIGLAVYSTSKFSSACVNFSQMSKNAFVQTSTKFLNHLLSNESKVNYILSKRFSKILF